MLDVSIIIVTYNSAKHIYSTLSSIEQHETACDYEVIVVDNNSQDQTKNIIRLFSRVTLIENDKNMGFAKANNIGAAYAKGKFVLFLNPDVQITDRSIDQLLQSINEQEQIGLVAPKLIYPDGSTQESVRRFPSFFVQVIGRIPGLKRFVRNAHEEYVLKNVSLGSGNVDWVIGAAMLMNKDVFKRIGMFDKRYFLYCEDMDLCYELFKRGLGVYYNASISLIHQYQQASTKSLSRQTLLHIQSICKFYLKHPELILQKVRGKE